jgi:hypothetical protein
MSYSTLLFTYTSIVLANIVNIPFLPPTYYRRIYKAKGTLRHAQLYTILGRVLSVGTSSVLTSLVTHHASIETRRSMAS